jgi:hypothetical protein
MGPVAATPAAAGQTDEMKGTMPMTGFQRVARKARLLPLAALAALPIGLGGPGIEAQAQSANQEIIITISRVRAIDKFDNFSKADFMARVSIDGDEITTKQIRQADSIRPNWVLAKRVKPGKHNVKLAVLDKDLTKAESVDINRLDGKRDLDFTVDTRNCRIDGFVVTYKCGQTIVRAGKERRASEVTFKVEVKKR